MPDFEQFKKWVFCQKCGRVSDAKTAKKEGWLVAPWKKDTSLNVVRCYRHITDWSLRMSVGRTDAAREMMRDGRERASQEDDLSNVFIHPAPLEDR